EDVKLSKNISTYKVNENKETSLPKASKTGYKFNGWIQVDSSGNEISSDSEDYVLNEAADKLIKGAATDVILKADFESITYSVTYVPNGKDVKCDGESVPSKTVLTGISYSDGTNDSSDSFESLPTDWERDGYTFKGFATSAKGDTAITTLAGLTTKKSIKIYAIWEANTNEITYSTNYILDGTEVSDGSFGVMGTTESQTYGKAFTPSKINQATYVFKGWKLVGTNSNVKVSKAGYVTSINKNNTSDVTLEAEFTTYTYKLNYSPNGGTYNSSKKTLKLNDSDSVKYTDDVAALVSPLVNTTKKGYTLSYIALDKKGKTPVISADGTIMYGESDSTITGLSSKNNGNVTLYAIWTKVKPNAIEELTASYSDGTLTVNIGESAFGAEAYEIQYSTNMLFIGGVTTDQISCSEEQTSYTYTASGLYGSKYYVRVRRIQNDSVGEDVKGSWSSTVRALKSVN
nr:InlB B-repeat-containing protein [Butyrivibrio sp.]